MGPVEFGAGTVMLAVPSDWSFWKQHCPQPGAPRSLMPFSASVLFSIILSSLPGGFVLSNVPMAYIRYMEADQQGPGVNSTPRHKRMELIFSYYWQWSFNAGAASPNSYSQMRPLSSLLYYTVISQCAAHQAWEYHIVASFPAHNQTPQGRGPLVSTTRSSLH